MVLQLDRTPSLGKIQLIGRWMWLHTQWKKTTSLPFWTSVKSDSDASKQHQFCPRGASSCSWCKWQQDLATTTNTYKDDDCLPEVFLEILHPIFMALSETKLPKDVFVEQHKIQTSVSTHWCGPAVQSTSTMVSKLFVVLCNLLFAISMVGLEVERGWWRGC